MNRRGFLGSVLLGSAAVHAQSRRPNVVLVVADDLGWGDLSINGCPDARTPHIDGIARQGIRFRQSYANAPECTPTRCALLTGQYQHRVGGLECAIGVSNIGRYDEAAWLQERGELGLPASEPTLGRLLKERGYDTACVGKWHLGYLDKFSPKRHGFDHHFGILGGNADYYTHEELNEGAGQARLFENGKTVKRSGYMTDLLAEEAIEWLKRRRARPFLLYLPFTAPHAPIQSPADFDPRSGTAPHRPRNRPTYVSMVERLDSRVGDVLRQLDAMGAAENTIVVFSSDNGADQNGRNEPFRGRKSSLWEGGIRAPLHVRWPGHIKSGSESEQVAMSMDLLPTLLEGIDGHQARVPPTDGVSLLQTWRGEQAPRPRTVFWRYRRGEATRKAVRHGDWKYVADGATRELHDLSQDVGEKQNQLASEPATARDLAGRIADWERMVSSPRLREYKRATG